MHTQDESISNLSVGVVGVGYWGSKHLRVLRSLPDVARVVAIDERVASMPDLAQAVARGDAFTSLTDALPHVDAVVIATPPTSHVDLALTAIRAGKHVLVEKPLATTSWDALCIVDAAREHDVRLMAGHTFEHNAAVKALREVIRSHELGDLYYLDSARLNLGLYQRDVNVVMDLAPHDVSIANFVLGATPTSVTAWGARHVHPTLEDVAYLRLDYDTLDVRANIHVSWLDPSKVRRTTAVGSRKMAVYNDMAAEERLRIFDKAVIADAREQGTPPSLNYHVGDVVSPRVAFDEPLSVQDAHFARCIIEGRQPDTDGHSGLAVVQVLEAAQISLDEGRRVQLDELESGRRTNRTFAVTVDLRDTVVPTAALHAEPKEVEHVAAAS